MKISVIVSVIILLILAGTITFWCFEKQKFDDYCNEHGYEKAIAWSQYSNEFTIMFLGQPNRSSVDCINEEGVEKFYLED